MTHKIITVLAWGGFGLLGLMAYLAVSTVVVNYCEKAYKWDCDSAFFFSALWPITIPAALFLRFCIFPWEGFFDWLAGRSSALGDKAYQKRLKKERDES